MSETKLQIQNLSLYYGTHQVLKNICLDVLSHEILGIIGPASSGKTSLLRALNRLNDDVPKFRKEGEVLLEGENIYTDLPVWMVRKRIGMIFALPTPLPLSIYENVAYGPRVHGMNQKKILDKIVEETLQSAFLWDEVKDRLDHPAMRLSGGQQQRLCIARTLAVQPEVILYDEPCSGLDPISTAKVEEAMTMLKSRYTQILVTNNTKQAARVSDRTAFFLMGEMVEINKTEKIFTIPQDKRTEDYVSGRFG
ncbi:MAG: phosphate ABC transporter ATP-binding protein [Candidatus Omnitrophica bacterium]|nr:phosphate ABC transporter ATP-binding protein [Candidatus Omnitrophota bacterium]